MSESLSSIVRNKSDTMKKRNFMREYGFCERDIHSLLYNGSAYANRALKVLRALGYETPDNAVDHLSKLLHDHKVTSLESLSVEAGYPRQTIQRWKNGEFSISWFHFRVMCDVLKCPIIAKLPR
jgi:hypothetical protein